MMKKNQGCYSLISPFFSVSYQHFNLKFSGHIWETCELASSSYTMQILELDEITHPSLVSFPVNYTSYSFRDLWRENKYIARKKLVPSFNLDGYRIFNFRGTSFEFSAQLLIYTVTAQNLSFCLLGTKVLYIFIRIFRHALYCYHTYIIIRRQLHIFENVKVLRA